MSDFKQRQIRVFISSTFRGLWDERDVLVRQVFPEIRHHCRARGVDFVEIDLRWGIPKEQVTRGESVPICFQQIDLCRPYFIGLLGEYYGSVILLEQREIACADYPWIENGYLDRSVTELEILYAMFNVGQNVSEKKLQECAENALFYFRDPHYVDTLPEKKRKHYLETSEENCQKQQNLKQRLRVHPCQITEYQQPIDLKSLVLEQLWTRIERKIPDTLTEQQCEDFEHDAFAASRQTVYIKRQADFERLTAHAQNDDPPLVIVGESGSGKSALLANWAWEYRQKHPNELVFWHFCGSSPASTDPIALLWRIMKTLQNHFPIEYELPITTEAVIEQFPHWLAKAQGLVILILDGLNQLEETPTTQRWLPNFIPAHIRLFLSTLPSTTDVIAPSNNIGYQNRKGWQTLTLPLLSDTERESLIINYLHQYAKILPCTEMQRILAAPQTANPLYLRIILEELRIFGHFHKLGQHLDHYLRASTIPELYQKVLARLEEDYQLPDYPNLVGNALSLLWASRRGVYESELLTMLEVPQAIWSPLYLALQNALVSRAGLLNFFHNYLREAVQAQYLSNEDKKRAMHRQLADNFAQQPLNSRIADELLYQLEQAGESERLQACISEIPMFLQLMMDGKEYELWGYWLRLETSDKMVDAYQKTLAKYEKIVPEADKLTGLNWLGFFFGRTGYVTAAIPLSRRTLKISEQVLGTEHPQTAHLMNNLAALLQAREDYQEAEQLYRRALETSEKVLGANHPDTAKSLNNLAELLRTKQNFPEAELLLRRALEIGEKVLGIYHPDMAISINNLALLLEDKGNFPEAKTLYYQALEIYEKVLATEHLLIATSLNNLAGVLYAQGDYQSAEPLLRHALEIREKVLGAEHPDIAQSLSNLASLLIAKGDYQKALPLYSRALQITKQAGLDNTDAANLPNLFHDLLLLKSSENYEGNELLYRHLLESSEKVFGTEHPLVARCLNNLAYHLQYKGDYQSAESLYRRALEIRENLFGTNHTETAQSLNNLAELLRTKGDYQKAKPLYRRALTIHEKLLGIDHSLVAISLNNLALLFYSKGDYEGAEPLYRRALKIREQASGAEHPETAKLLDNLAELLRVKGDYDGALPLCRRALKIREQVLDADHPDTANSLNNLALLLKTKGDYEDAEPLYRRALTIYKKVLGTEHPDTALPRNNLALLLYNKGDYEAAESLLRRAVAIAEKNLGVQHPDTILFRDNLALLLKKKNNPYGKVSRNAPCPCGSGKKYKRCHGKW